MAQSGFTPVQLYRSITAAAVPTAGNLVAGELAINLTDEKLYFENASGVVKVLADSTYVGTVTSVDASGGTTGLTFSGGPITTSGTLTLAGTLAVANGGTGVTTSTGTASVVLSNSPTLVTPTLGAASATSIANGLGAVGTPSYTFTGDLNTGLWSPGVDTIAFSTNGAERMRLDSSGNLGIGTASLAARFTVNGGAGTSQTRFEVSTTEVQEVATNAAQSAYANRLADAAQHIWKITGTERMRIDASGNVGIGTSSPGGKLDVVSSSFNIVSSQSTTSFAGFQRIAPAGQFTYDFYNIGGVEAARITVTDTNIMVFSNGSAATERMRIDASGNLLVGSTAAPSGSGTNLQVSNAGSARMWLTSTGNRNFYLESGAANALQFVDGTAAAERMRIDSSGNVGIGTSSPGAKLDVNGSINASGNAQLTNASYCFAGVTSGAVEGQFAANGGGEVQLRAVSNHPLSVYTNNTERMRIDASGNVGIGETAPDYKLDVNGTFGFTPGASVTPVDNGDVVFELTNNTTLTVKAKGSDGVVRSGTITLA